MRVRVIQDKANRDWWAVETKKGFFSLWKYHFGTSDKEWALREADRVWRSQSKEVVIWEDGKDKE